jgi:imidazolonepropionase-like amidohydrolase
MRRTVIQMQRWLVCLAALLGVTLIPGFADAGSASLLVLRGATILDGTGGPPLRDAALVIEDGRISAIGPVQDVHPARGARVVDVQGKYIVPGLMDANVHLDFGVTPEYLFGYDGRYDELVLEAAQVELSNGVTTVFDTWGPREPLVKVRDAINAGHLTGSRIFLGGNIIGMGGPTSPDFYPAIRTVINKVDADRIDAIWEQGVGPNLLWMTPSEVREKVSTYIRSGRIDFVKYLSSGHKEMQFIAFSPDAQKAIVEEAHRAGLTAQAHSTSPESLRLEIEAGADFLQHCDISGVEPIPDETIRVILDRQLPCAALLMTDRYLAWSAEHGPAALRPLVKVKDLNDRKLIAAGAVLLLTSDGGLFGLKEKAESNPLVGPRLMGAPDIPNQLGDAHVLWLKAAIERGMTPMNALLSSTRNVARAYGKAKDLGTLEVGKRADLVVLSADPLADPDNYRNIVDVYKDGIRVDRSTLPTKRIMSPQ